MQCFSVLGSSSVKWVSLSDLQMEADHGGVFCREQGLGLELLHSAAVANWMVLLKIQQVSLCAVVLLRFWCSNPVAVSHCYSWKR